MVQIHGFRSREGESAVLTAGAAQQPSHIETRLQTALRTLFSEWGPVLNASARPELAGRKNVQGQAISGNGVFVHLELSKATRDGLLKAPDQLLALHHALLEVQP